MRPQTIRRGIRYDKQAPGTRQARGRGQGKGGGGGGGEETDASGILHDPYFPKIFANLCTSSCPSSLLEILPTTLRRSRSAK